MRTVRSGSSRACYEAALETSAAERRLPALVRMLVPSSVRRRQPVRQSALPSIALGLLTVMLRPSPVLALNPFLDISQYGHTAWTSRSGFLNGAVYAISQTPDGYLWLGTQSGVVRFDGVRAVPLALPPGQQFPSAVVEVFLPARDGTLWIGTLDGLMSWKNGQLTQHPAFAHHIVVTLLQDRGGTVWAGGVVGAAGKLCAIRGESTTCYGDDGNLGAAAASLYEDSDGSLWVGAGTGIWRWNPGPPTRYLATPIRGHQALTQGDHGSGLMVACDGVRQIVGTKVVDYPLPGAPFPLTAANLLRDRNGGLWIGTTTHGLVHSYQGKTSVFTHNDGLSSDQVNALFEDREGTVWVATSDGLDQFRELPVTSLSVKQGLSSASVASVLAARDGSIWIGTADGLNRWSHGRMTIYRRRNDPGLPDDDIQSLFEDERGRIWVSGYRGLAVFENSKFTAVPSVPIGYKHAIASDNRGGLWLSLWLPANDYGLAHLVDGNIIERVPWQDLGGGPGSGLVPDPDGSTWVGMVNGGIAFFRSGHVQKLPLNDRETSKVMNLSRDRHGTMWAATENGLSRIANGRVTTLTTANGLPCNSVHWFIEDDRSSYWLHTQCGLLQIARTELDDWTADAKRTVRVTTFDAADGVRLNETPKGYRPWVAKSSDGRIWFVNYDAVSFIDPAHIGVNGAPPAVHGERITANGKTYDAKRGLRLPPLVHDLTIDYTSLSFITPERVRFRYQLEGQDPDWREVINKREVQYSNLPPGRYRFRVMASNNGRIWNEAGDVLEFSVAPAYYQTNWFRLLCAATFVTMIWFFYHLRVRSLERRHAEIRALNEALRESEAYRAEAESLAHTGSWAVDVARDRYIYCSEEDLRIFGFDPKGPLPTREMLFQRIVPEDLKNVEESFRKTLREKVDTSCDYGISLPDGTVKHIHVIRHPVLNDAGDVVSLVGTAMDVTERKRAEEVLRESETRFRTFVDHAADAVIIQDEQGIIVDVNRQGCEGLGYTRQEVVGMPPSASFCLNLDREGGEKQALAGEMFDRHWHRRKDGVQFPVEVHTNVFWYSGRRLLLKVARDISDRLRAEEQREKLRQLEADLAHINRVSMLGELTASIAHEVNQPIAGVVSNGSACLRWLARDVPDLEEAREAARRIVRDGKRAGEIIARIRSLTKGALTPIEKLDLNETIQEILTLVGDEAKRNGVTIRTHLAGDLSPVSGDRVQLQQVILNLIMNGIEAMGGVSGRAHELAITTRNIEAEHVQATVEDTGTGLKPNTIDKIFDPFYTTKSGGMGMGLSICRSILQAHGGRIWATANDGRGTSFHFVLPKYHEVESHADIAAV